MVGAKVYTDMAVVTALAMACLMALVLVSAQEPAPSASLSPSSSPFAVDSNTPPCWAKILKCWGESFNQTTLLDVTNPDFNLSKTLCCPVFKEQVQTETKCFCSISPDLDDDPRVVPNLDQVFSACKISGTFESICEGKNGASAVGPMTSLMLLLGSLMFF